MLTMQSISFDHIAILQFPINYYAIFSKIRSFILISPTGGNKELDRIDVQKVELAEILKEKNRSTERNNLEPFFL